MMTVRRSGGGAGVYWGIAGFALLIGAVAFWLTRPDDSAERREDPTAGEAAERQAEGLGVGESTAIPGARAPARIIPDNGRLRVTREELREGDVLAIGLAMPDEARGEAPRRIKVADVSGRAMEGRGVAIDGAGNGLRLEVDPNWLRPGRYLIQVETAEQKPLALRRYVLEVVEEDAAR
jgi:hypothetical protein